MGGYVERARRKEWDWETGRAEPKQKTIEIESGCSTQCWRWKEVEETIDICKKSTPSSA
jgi:hypothetical protein